MNIGSYKKTTFKFTVVVSVLLDTPSSAGTDINTTLKKGGSILVQTLMKVEPSKMKWVVKFVQKWNVTIHPYNLEWDSTFFLDLRREKKHVLLYTGSK